LSTGFISAGKKPESSSRGFSRGEKIETESACQNITFNFYLRLLIIFIAVLVRQKYYVVAILALLFTLTP
jgi:hypothetical protein